MKTRYIAALCLLLMMSATAQDLTKEIVIEKDIIPEERNATRLNTAPAISLPAVAKKKLNYGEWKRSSEIPASISMLEPVTYADTLSVSPFRGYVDLGYFPIYNTALSAGYRFINTENTCMNGWIQYDGKIYDGKMFTGDEVTLRNHAVSVGVDVVQRVDQTSILTAGINYQLNRYNNPVFGTMAYEENGQKLYKTGFGDGYSQTVNRVDLSLDWKSSVGVVNYNAGIGFGHFGYGQDGEMQVYGMTSAVVDDYAGMLKPVRENRFALYGNINLPVNDNAKAGADVEFAYLNYNRGSKMAFDLSKFGHVLVPMNDPDYGKISIIPYYDYSTEKFAVRLGAKIDIAISDGKALYVAPDVKVDWTPSSMVAVYGRLGGGQQLNALGSLFDVAPYSAPMFAYGKSTLPITIDGGMVLGPWRGGYFEVFGGYAKANDWLMPSYNNDITYFSGVDIDGWHVGAAAGYNYRDIVDAKVRYEAAPQEYDKGYFLWRDRARYVVNASLKVTPIKPLDITFEYNLRGKRRVKDECYVDRSEMNVSPYISHRLYNLKNMNKLSIGALYRFTSQLSAFGRVENLFDNDYELIGCIPAQGIMVLLGGSYKF